MSASKTHACDACGGIGEQQNPFFLYDEDAALSMTCPVCLGAGQLPDAMPAGLSDEFAEDAVKRGQWKAFLSRNRLEASELSQAVTEVREFVAEPLHLARERGRDRPKGIENETSPFRQRE